MATTEIDDNQNVSVTLRKEQFVFLQTAMRFYRDLLIKETEETEESEELKVLFQLGSNVDPRVKRELNKVENSLEFLEEYAGIFDTGFGLNLGPVSLGFVRHLKGIGLLYVSYLRVRRHEFAKRPNLTKLQLQRLDESIARKEEFLTSASGFANAVPAVLLAAEAQSTDETLPSSAAGSLVNVPRARPQILDTIPLLDPELRDRSGELFSIYSAKGDHDKLDTALSEGTRILENRLRQMLGVTGKTGPELLKGVFSGTSPRFVISKVPDEQGAAHQLFLFLFSHVRNPVAHNLKKGYTPERALQLLGTIDYAIHLLETATDTQPLMPSSPSQSPSS